MTFEDFKKPLVVQQKNCSPKDSLKKNGADEGGTFEKTYLPTLPLLMGLNTLHVCYPEVVHYKRDQL